VKVHHVNKIEELFPVRDVALSSNVQAVLVKVPYARSAEEYVNKFRQNEKQLAKDDPSVYLFARRLYEICVSVSLETYVNDLMYAILMLGDFFLPPLSFRQKPKIYQSYGDLHLVSVPDYGIFRSTESMSLGVPEIVGVAVENKTRSEKPAVGQAIASALTCSLHNYSLYDLDFPISVLRGRGIHLSFMRASFSTEFMDTIQAGEVPFHLEAQALVFPQRPSHGAHLGLNLLEYDGRRIAFEALACMHDYLLKVPLPNNGNGEQ